MRFHYTASDPNGRLVEGYVESQTPTEVLDWMANQGWKPVSLKAIQETGTRKILGALGRRGSINIADQVFLTKYLALMLKVGTDLFKAIDILAEDFDKPAVKSFLIEVRETLSKGQPFYSAFSRYPNYFSPVFINMVKAGESSGNLEKVFDDLSTDLEKQQEIRDKIKAALIYPIILVIMATAILLVLVTFILPRIAQTFLTSGIQPPVFTRIVFDVGLFVGNNIAILLPSAGVIIAAIWLFLRTSGGKKFLNQTLSRLPVIKDVLAKIALQRFAATFSSLLKSGLPILDALQITAGASGSLEMETALNRIAQEGVAKGLTIGEAFRRESVFPRVVVNLLTISERAGHMENILQTLSDFYATEIDSSIKILMSFLEPALLLIMGLVVGGIALSIIVPIYQLTASYS
ncbi:MAG: type II secretion system F family protein [Patescibacteria group bacterium]|nr:type II secretion system F family protein [Patescibacteria group bacterium]